MRGYVYIHINYMRLMDEKTKEKKEKQNLHCKCGENKERKKAKDGSSLSLYARKKRMKKILQLLATVHTYICYFPNPKKKSFYVWITLLQQKSASTYSSSSLSCPMHHLNPLSSPFPFYVLDMDSVYKYP